MDFSDDHLLTGISLMTVASRASLTTVAIEFSIFGPTDSGGWSYRLTLVPHR